MKIFNYIKSLSLAVMVLPLLLLVSSCDDSDVIDPSRLFRPVGIDLKATENTIRATWYEIEGATGYHVELYVRDRVKDPELGEDSDNYDNKVLVASEENIKGKEWVVKDLEFGTTYYFRLKANSPDPTYSSRFSSFVSVSTADEIQVISIPADGIDPDLGNVTFKFLENYKLEYILLVNRNGKETKVDIRGMTGETFVVEGLEAGDYTATVYDKERAYNTIEFTIPILKPLAKKDNTIEGVTLRWVTIPGIDRILIAPINEEDDIERIYRITASMNNELQITDLKPFVGYTATILFNDDSEGNTIRFTTKESAPAGTIEVHDAEEFKNLLEKSSAEGGAPDGSVLALHPGTYLILTEMGELSNLKVAKNITIMAYSDDKPVIQAKGLQLHNTVDLDLVKVENIHWDGQNDVNAYLFDYRTEATGMVKELVLEGCLVTDLYNSVLRDDRIGTNGVLNFTINNCEMYNMNAKQCIIAMGNEATSYNIESVTISNSTIANIGYDQVNTRFLSFAGNNNMVVTLKNNTIVINSATNNSIDYRYAASGATNLGKFEMINNIIYNMNVAMDRYAKSPNFEKDGKKALVSIRNVNLFKPFVKSVSSVTGAIEKEHWGEYGVNTEDPGFEIPKAEDGTQPDPRDFTLKNENLQNLQMGDPRWWTN